MELNGLSDSPRSPTLSPGVSPSNQNSKVATSTATQGSKGQKKNNFYQLAKMFRMNISQIDPSEERKMVREGVKKNVAAFVTLVCLIRVGKFAEENVPRRPTV